MYPFRSPAHRIYIAISRVPRNNIPRKITCSNRDKLHTSPANCIPRVRPAEPPIPSILQSRAWQRTIQEEPNSHEQGSSERLESSPLAPTPASALQGISAQMSPRSPGLALSPLGFGRPLHGLACLATGLVRCLPAAQCFPSQELRPTRGRRELARVVQFVGQDS